MAVKDWSTTASSNSSVGGISVAENMTRANVNDAIRGMMAELRTAFNTEPYNVKRDGTAVGDGVTDDTAAFVAALATGRDVAIPPGTYKVANLSMATQGQRLVGSGRVILQKNANGPIITVSAADCQLENIAFYGDASTPTLTGNNVTITANSCALLNCGSRWAYGRAVLCTSNQLLILGTNDIYQTADTTTSGYDIEIGISGTATLYHRIYGIRTSQATGGILLTDTGAATIEGSQFGKLTAQPGTSPSGVHGPLIVGCRMNGKIAISVSNTSFTSCSTSADFEASGSITGVCWDSSNLMASGQTFTIGANVSLGVFDIASIVSGGVTAVINNYNNQITLPTTSYSPSWTASSSNPAIGNGTITASYTINGRRVTVSLKLECGSTTTFGSGEFRFSLPVTAAASPTNSIGSAKMLDDGVSFRVGVAEVAASGTYFTVTPDSGATACTAAVPFTWGTNDTMWVTLEYAI